MEATPVPVPVLVMVTGAVVFTVTAVVTDAVTVTVAVAVAVAGRAVIAVAGKWWCLSSTTARESHQLYYRTCSNASPVVTRLVPVRPAAPAWGWRSSLPSSKPITAGSR